MRKWMIGVGVVLVVVAAAGSGGYYYWDAQRPLAAAAEATSVSARATRGDIVLKVSGSGSVAAETKESVKAGLNGTIEELGFKAGDHVTAGQVLAVFEKEDVSGQIDQKVLSIKKQQLQLEQYEKQYKEAAVADEADPASLASIQLNIEVLKLEMAAGEKELAELREQQAERLEVTAAIDGVVTVSEVAVGDTVQANTIIADIVDYNALTFNVQVDELDMPRITVGQSAEIHLTAFPDKTFEGEILELAKEGSVSGGVAAYEVAIALKEVEGVLAGMSGQADMIIDSRENVVVVPVDAVVELMGRTYVRVPAEGASDASSPETGQPPSMPGGERTGGAAGAGAGEGAAGPGGESWSGAAGVGAGEGAVGPGGGRRSAVQGGADGEAVPERRAAGAGGAMVAIPAMPADGQIPQRPSSGPGRAEGEVPMPSGQARSQETTLASSASGDADGQSAPAQAPEAQAPGVGGQTAPDLAGDDRISAMAERIGLGGQLKEVTVGLSDETYVEIVSGLSEGDTVLVPLPQGTVGTAPSSAGAEMMFPGGMGGNFGNFGGGGFGGGGQGSGGMRGGMPQGGGAR
ncbi:efflux RND transporter periplasmic adaptor subunit [Paenibacillus agaridevorans]|uniref:efflux RND transporter periplasmic adaptor subunit n=1 Tax=Paenibacillus agaridevorans TaxID=171404 RepID=UPI001BE3DEEA|nr:efflux RND transporter periplasmic adaptor subunit [Paenibacillus agaridevorans]